MSPLDVGIDSLSLETNFRSLTLESCARTVPIEGVRPSTRANATFAKPEVYEYLEEWRVLYAIGLSSNEVLQREIALC